MQNAPREHSAILSTFIKLPFVLKTFILSVFEWPLKTVVASIFYVLIIVLFESVQTLSGMFKLIESMASQFAFAKLLSMAKELSGHKL